MRISRLVSILCLGLMPCAFSHAQQTVDLPDSLTGTYALEQHNESNPTLAVGRMKLVIDGAKNTLCLNGVVSQSIENRGNGEYRVTPTSGTAYTMLLLTPANTFHEIVFGSALYRGQRSSTAVDCIKEIFPASVDKILQGTYSFKFFGVATDVPATGEGTLVVGEKQLCVNGLTLGNPYYESPVDKDGVGVSSFWLSPSKSYAYIARELQNSASHKAFGIAARFSSIQVQQVVNGVVTATRVGAFNDFVKISDSTVCTSTALFSDGSSASGGTTTPTLTATEQSVFTLAAELIPAMFGNPGPVLSYQGYTYRHFAASGIYIGLKDGKVFGLGGSFGSAIKDLGTTDSVLKYLQDRKKGN